VLREGLSLILDLLPDMAVAGQDIYRTMLAGATGYVLKDVPRDELILAIRTVASGQWYMSRTAGAKFAGRIGAPQTEREFSVLRCIAAGHANKEIADALSISEGTVKSHVNNGMQK
jgi:two-component system NarL family response regulator